MKTKVFMLVSVFMLVVTFVFAAGGDGETPATEGTGEPQYGGTFTLLQHRSGLTAPRHTVWDPAKSHWLTVTIASPFAERLLIGDIDKYGPRGAGEFKFTDIEYIPLQFLEGQLCERWEVTTDPIGVVFYIRPGVMWTGNDNIGMAPREFVADDAVFHLETFKASPQGPELYFVEKIYAKDKYTFAVEFNSGQSFWPFLLGFGSRSGHAPPEAYAAPGGIDEWKNQVGTGPFILSDFVIGSQITYKRNPNYWDSTTIDGVEYQMPFVDELIFPLMSDMATQIAALRTGKVDWHTGVQLMYEQSLEKTTPELEKYKYPIANSKMVCLKSDGSNKIFDDRNVRRAMMIGTDLEAVTKGVWSEGNINAFPLNSGAAGIFVPLDEMPDSTRMLFDYNPELAKKMLAEAGYPNGFDITLNTGTTGNYPDTASMLASLWERIGISTKIISMEAGTSSAMRTSHDYEDSYLTETGTSMIPWHISLGLYGEGRTYNFAEYKNQDFNDLFLACEVEMDWDTMLNQGKELFLMLLDDAPYIPLGNPIQISYNWPWVENYYGEIETGFCTYTPMLSRLWIDQRLKSEMGY
jgi:peptide/nickel transport system substrate-binding protein